MDYQRDYQQDYQRVVEVVGETGLAVRGGFRPLGAEEEKEIPGGAKTVILVGNAGPVMWSAFAAAGTENQRRDAENPLDDWTREILEEVAVKLACRALFPFDGPPFLPFQRWALCIGTVFVSPIGPLIHPKYGLWHAYRGALAFDQRLDLPEPPGLAGPCDTCAEKPCLESCPAGAFPPKETAPDGVNYDVAACVRHIESEAGEPCMSGGCLARRACPVGKEYTYPSTQARFHMGRFLKSQTEA